jgi:hypothetical protein
MVHGRRPELSLHSIPARLDTSALADPAGAPTRALVVIHPGELPFAGVAILHADFRVRAAAPVTVRDPLGRVVPSRLVTESLGALEGDGRRRWTFDLEFLVDIVPAHAIAYAAVFGAHPDSHVPDDAWEKRHAAAVPLVAVETQCQEGDLPNPFSLAGYNA